MPMIAGTGGGSLGRLLITMQQSIRQFLEILASGLAFVAVSALLFWPVEELLEGEKATRPKLKDLAYLWLYRW